jgi:hypothetical protein
MQHLDQEDLAQRWLVSPRTLEAWRWQGRGPLYLKIGGRVLYRLADIEAFENRNLHANTVGTVDLNDEERPADGNWRQDVRQTPGSSGWRAGPRMVPAPASERTARQRTSERKFAAKREDKKENGHSLGFPRSRR